MTRDRCRYFNGIQHDMCEAGVVYDSVTDEKRPTFMQRLPCANPDVPCARRSYPTQEEVDASEAAWRRSISNVATARTAIIAKHGKARGVSGEMPCPVCRTGMLRYSIARLNGHVHGACTTAGCARWME